MNGNLSALTKNVTIPREGSHDTPRLLAQVNTTYNNYIYNHQWMCIIANTSSLRLFKPNILWVPRNFDLDILHCICSILDTKGLCYNLILDDTNSMHYMYM